MKHPSGKPDLGKSTCIFVIDVDNTPVGNLEPGPAREAGREAGMPDTAIVVPLSQAHLLGHPIIRGP